MKIIQHKSELSKLALGGFESLFSAKTEQDKRPGRERYDAIPWNLSEGYMCTGNPMSKKILVMMNKQKN